MDDDVFDEISDLEESLDRATKAEHFARLAEEAPPGSARRVAMLAVAGDHWQLRGEFDRARACFEAMAEAGDDDELPAAAYLVSLFLESGDDARADQLASELRARATREDLGYGYAFLGEAYEQAGRLREALRWFTLSNSFTDPDDLDQLDAQAVIGRARVRRALELPMDRYDDSAAILQEQSAGRWPRETG